MSSAEHAYTTSQRTMLAGITAAPVLQVTPAAHLRLIEGGAGKPKPMMKWEQKAWDRLMARPEECWFDVIRKLRDEMFALGWKASKARSAVLYTCNRMEQWDALQRMASIRALQPLVSVLEEAAVVPLKDAEIRAKIRRLTDVAENDCSPTRAPARCLSLLRRIRQRIAAVQKSESRPKPKLQLVAQRQVLAAAH